VKIRVLFFGMSKDIVGKNEEYLEFDDDLSVEELRQRLNGIHPGLNEMGTYAVAVNEAYAEEGKIISDHDTIAIIPPVSGG
jgi:molybdopterin synthase sulfur carrier subunit